MKYLSLLLLLCSCTTELIDEPAPAPLGEATAELGLAPFVRRADNPRLRAGTRYGTLIDTAIADPDVHWDGARAQWRAYYMASRGTSFLGELQQVIRLAVSPDAKTWTPNPTPALVASTATTAWDHDRTETPSVAINPNAPPARRYLMLYSGALGNMPGQGFANYAIGAAFSSDGVTFQRVSATESPHRKAGLVMTGKDVYPTAHAAIVADPEVLYRNGLYHAWFSSYACATVAATCDTPTAFGIAYATSPDGVHWTQVSAGPLPSLLRDPASRVTGGQQPSVVWDPVALQYEMWLTSDDGDENDVQPTEFNNTMGVWRATSPDGKQWSIRYDLARDFTWSPTAPGEAIGLATGIDVARRGDHRLMLYVGYDDKLVPDGFFLPDRTALGYRPGVMALGVALRSPPAAACAGTPTE